MYSESGAHSRCTLDRPAISLLDDAKEFRKKRTNSILPLLFTSTFCVQYFLPTLLSYTSSQITQTNLGLRAPRLSLPRLLRFHEWVTDGIFPFKRAWCCYRLICTFWNGLFFTRVDGMPNLWRDGGAQSSNGLDVWFGRTLNWMTVQERPSVFRRWKMPVASPESRIAVIPPRYMRLQGTQVTSLFALSISGRQNELPPKRKRIYSLSPPSLTSQSR